MNEKLGEGDPSRSSADSSAAMDEGSPSSRRSATADRAPDDVQEKMSLSIHRHDDDDPEMQTAHRVDTRASVRSKASRVLSTVSHRSRTNREGLRYDALPVTNLDEGVVGWDGQDDPDMPLNFARARKWMLVALLSVITLLTPFASSILSPGIASLDEEFKNGNSVIGSMTVSIYLLGYVVGPLFLAPLSEIYGRKPVLGAANVFFCVWQIGCALAPSIETLIVFRFFSGVGGAGCLTLGGGVIGDLFRPDERGSAMSMWTIGPLLGPTIGPLIGGFVAESIGWRWDFWIVLCVAVAVTVLIEVFNQETSHKVLIERKTLRLRKELGRPELRSCYDNSVGKSRTRVLLDGLVLPIKMLTLSPLVFFISLYIAFVYGVLYILFTTIPSVFEETYGFDVRYTGLVYLSMGLGNLIGWIYVTFYSDRTVVRLAKANDGVFEPEMRLTISMSFGSFLPITLFWYGWTAYYKTHWISPILSLIPFGVGAIGVFLPLTTYIVDAYPMHASSAIAANTVFRSAVGTVLPLAGPPMYQALGLGWGNSLLGFICVAMIPIPIVFYKFGSRLRKAQRFKL